MAPRRAWLLWSTLSLFAACSQSATEIPVTLTFDDALAADSATLDQINGFIFFVSGGDELRIFPPECGGVTSEGLGCIRPDPACVFGRDDGDSFRLNLAHSYSGGILFPDGADIEITVCAMDPSQGFIAAGVTPQPITNSSETQSINIQLSTSSNACSTYEICSG